jgi:hypothetical protein
MLQAKSSAIRLSMAKQRQGRVLARGVGKISKVMDAALPGKHAWDISDKLKRR